MPPSRYVKGCWLCENFDDGLVDGVLGDKANDLLCYLATLEDQKGGNAADAVTHRRGSVGINVHLHDLEFAMVVVGHFVDDGCESPAGTAPGGPKIYKYGFFRL